MDSRGFFTIVAKNMNPDQTAPKGALLRSTESILLVTKATKVLLDFSLTVKTSTLFFISGRGSAISSAKEGKSGFIYNLVKGQ